MEPIGHSGLLQECRGRLQTVSHSSLMMYLGERDEMPECRVADGFGIPSESFPRFVSLGKYNQAWGLNS